MGRYFRYLPYTKNKMNKTSIFILSFLFSILPSLAQNFEEDMKTAISFSNNKKVISELQHTLYTLNDNTPIESETISLVRDGKYYHSISYGKEQICNEKYNVIINHNAKLVIVRSSLPKDSSYISNKNLDEARNAMNSFIQAMNEMSTQTTEEKDLSNIHYLGVSHGEKVYNVSLPFGPYERAEYYFSAKSGFLIKSIYYTRDAQILPSGAKEKVKLVALSKKFKTKGRIKKELFSIKNIFEIDQDNNVTLLGKYKDYTPIVEF